MLEYLFNDIVDVNQLDPTGKKFNKVSRIVARSQNVGLVIELDVCTDMYPVNVGDKFKLVLVSTINLDGTLVTNFSSKAKGKTLADDFDYVMYGKLYKITEHGSESSSKRQYKEIHVSFGGLLMELKGDAVTVANFKPDQNMFLLMKKNENSPT